jgi:Dehydrogenase E1 component
VSTVAPPNVGDLTKEHVLDAYRVMCTIREFEERLHREFATGEIPGFVHLYSGEEAIVVGVISHLRPEDYVASTHRGRGHAIAKGCDVRAMMAEIFGKRTGLRKGKGGSMHIADLHQGMLGANGIVGGGPPPVCGVGLTAKVKRTDQVAVSFTGDGGSNQGTFLEALNPRERVAPAVHLRGREQRLRRGHLERLSPGRNRRRQARRRLRDAGRGGRDRCLQLFRSPPKPCNSTTGSPPSIVSRGPGWSTMS